MAVFHTSSNDPACGHELETVNEPSVYVDSLDRVAMDTLKEKARPYSYSQQQESLEINPIYNGASDLEVAPQVARGPEPYHNRYTDFDQQPSSPHDTSGKLPVERRRICGVTPLIFWILIFAIVVILAAGLGGGLAAGLSSKNSDKSTESASRSASIRSAGLFNATDTSTTSPQAIIPASPSGKPAHTASPTPTAQITSAPSPAKDQVTCPDNDTLVYTPPSNTVKSTAYTVNSTTLTYTIYCNQSFSQSDDISDLQYIENSNLTACIQACSIYSTQVPNGGGEYGYWSLCSGVTVTENGTCELKEGLEVGAAGTTKKGGKGQSAMLLW